jgi:hypothetical protein
VTLTRTDISRLGGQAVKSKYGLSHFAKLRARWGTMYRWRVLPGTASGYALVDMRTGNIVSRTNSRPFGDGGKDQARP